MAIPLIVGGYIAKGVATYVGQKVLLDAAERVSEGRFMQDLKSGQMLDDMVNSAKNMVSNPIDTAWEGVKSKAFLSVFDKLGTKGQVALGVASAIFSKKEEVSLASKKMKI